MSKSQSKSGSRKSKRALVKPHGESGPKFALAAEVNQAFQQLSNNQRQLGEVVNKTNQGMIQAFTMQDAHLHIQRRIMNDFVVDIVMDNEGTIKTTDTGIDWDWYFREYEGMRCAVMLVEWIKKITAPDEDKPEESLVVQAAAGDKTEAVFGGDYESGSIITDG